MLHIKFFDFNKVLGNLTNTIKEYGIFVLSGVIIMVKVVLEVLVVLLLILLTTFYLFRDGEFVWCWWRVERCVGRDPRGVGCGY